MTDIKHNGNWSIVPSLSEQLLKLCAQRLEQERIGDVAEQMSKECSAPSVKEAIRSLLQEVFQRHKPIDPLSDPCWQCVLSACVMGGSSVRISHGWHLLFIAIAIDVSRARRHRRGDGQVILYGAMAALYQSDVEIIDCASKLFGAIAESGDLFLDTRPALQVASITLKARALTFVLSHGLGELAKYSNKEYRELHSATQISDDREREYWRERWDEVVVGNGGCIQMIEAMNVAVRVVL